MGYVRHLHRHLIKYVVFVTVIFLLSSLSAAQASKQGTTQAPAAEELNKYPGLLPEFGQLLQKIQREVQFPPARSQSHLLTLLPQSTTFYAAFPNLGDASNQVLKIFQTELQQSPVLHAWWQHSGMATGGPKLEDFLGNFYQLSQYLGDEIVVFGTTGGGKEPEGLILAEVRKPGLKIFLEQQSKSLAGNSKQAVRVLDVTDLASLKDSGSPQQPVILVRPDLVVGALNVATLRNFNAQIERNSREFASTEFGQRLAQTYQGGTTALGAVDLQKILRELPRSTPQNQMALERTGFSDVKYLVWEHKSTAGQSTSQMELSFTGPRHGIASWLRAPGPLGSLDFVSPKAVFASSILLKDPAQIFDEIKDLSTSSNPKAFAGIAQMEQALRLSLRNDLLGQLGGEITVELDSLVQSDPKWKAVLRVNDPDRLQATLSTLLARAQFGSQESSEGGITYHTLRIPSARKAMEIGYAFVDGYLVIASGHEAVVEAVRLHRSGESLAKSKKFLAALPAGRGADVSALFYEDPVAMAALSLRQALPQMGESLSKAATETAPVVFCAYGEESAIREASKGGGADAGAFLVAAAIAIPNLLRARIAANEASAVSTIRTANTAQIIYSNAYPQRGFARDLASLGPNPGSAGTWSSDHAGVIDATLGNSSCIKDAWCTKSGFRFSISAMCKKQRCEDFVVVGTPVSVSAGTKNFCSTSDAVVRYKTGPPLTSMVSVSECQAWSPLQ
ncbi:MAG TPA: hypothetical protein VFA74_02705 [Terriglobales bacterium]|nr:hypothetical protein [Terriglobales bacterium]